MTTVRGENNNPRCDGTVLPISQTMFNDMKYHQFIALYEELTVIYFTN